MPQVKIQNVSKRKLHLVFLNGVPVGPKVQRFRIEQNQLDQLISFVRRTFRTDDKGGAVSIRNAGYSPRDVFFEANGNYHLFNTCNNWTAAALRQAGIRAPLWAPFAFGIDIE